MGMHKIGFLARPNRRCEAPNIAADEASSREPNRRTGQSLRLSMMILLFIVALLQAADVLTTNGFLSAPGAIEGNPLMAASQIALGQFWWLPKMILLPIILFNLGKYHRLWPAAVVAALYILTVGNNLYIIAATQGL